MSIVTLAKWGNSIGIRIPASIIKEANLSPGEKLEITSDHHGGLALAPIKNQQDGWREMFNAVADAGQDNHLLNVTNKFDADEWTW